MGFWAFQLLCARRAASDLWQFAQEHLKAALFGIIVSSPAIPLSRHLGSTASQEVWSIVIQCLIGPIGLIAVSFCWSWARSPFELWREAVESAPEPMARVDGPEPFRERRASYALWDMIDPLDMYQVACLWIDLAPPDSPDVELVGDASASLYALQRAVEQGKLAPTYEHLTDMEKMSLRLASIGNPPKPWPATKKTRFTRDALRAYATKLGARPRFLFPEARAHGWMGP